MHCWRTRMSDLNLLREQIDEIDAELIRLFARRMEIAADIARAKSNSDAPIFNPEREQVVIQRAADQVPEELQDGARSLFSTITRISRGVQYGMCDWEFANTLHFAPEIQPQSV